MKICFFCNRPIEGKAEKHHVIPRRLFKRGENHRGGNLRSVHPSCHIRMHREIDNPMLSRERFIEVFSQISFGEGIFENGP